MKKGRRGRRGSDKEEEGGRGEVRRRYEKQTLRGEARLSFFQDFTSQRQQHHHHHPPIGSAIHDIISSYAFREPYIFMV